MMSPNIINLLDIMHDSRNLSEKNKQTKNKKTKKKKKKRKKKKTKKKRKILPTVNNFDLKFCSYPKYANT